ncbi:MAG: radical SAM protein [Thermoleophilia bacterium]|nr:radical SAM protein [Thermoleophilia bacterium]
MKVLLVQPQQFGKPGFAKVALVEPLGLEMVAGALIPDHEVKIHDMRIDRDLAGVIESFRPDAVGISCCFTIDVYRTQDIAKTCKESGVPFVFVGGLHASLNPPDFETEAIDCVAVGEGEFVSRELVDTLQAGGDLRNVPGLYLNTGDGQAFTGPRTQVPDLDELPFAARQLLPKRRRRRYFFNFWKPLAVIETARGCPHRCNFCSVWAFFEGRCRTKSPERVADELARLDERYVLITDDNFLLNVKRAVRIAEILKERRIKKRYSFQARSDTIVRNPEIISQWREVGLGHIFIGFESLDEEELKAVNKKSSVETNERALKIVQAQGITVTSAFIINPDYGHKEFERLRNYIRDRRIPVPQFTVLTPLPGTDLFKEIESKIQTKNYELYDFLHSVVPTKLDPHDFYNEFASLYKSAYVNSGVLLKRIGPLMAGLATRRLTISHLRRILRSAREFGDGRNYLQAIKSARKAREAG